MTELKWSMGPKFPDKASFQSAAVSAPDGTFLVTGGQAGQAGVSVPFIFRLECMKGPIIEHCIWNKFNQELSVAIASHVALIVSDSYVEMKGYCKKETISTELDGEGPSNKEQG